MKRETVRIGVVLAVLGGAWQGAEAQEGVAEQPPSCEPGFHLVPEVEYKEVEYPVCKVVPDMRTKWIYSTKPDYYCIPACPLFAKHHGDSCPQCRGPFCRPKLLKKKIEYECGTKCVVEVVKEKVPCLVWRKVPGGPGHPEPDRGAEVLPAPAGSPPTQGPGAPPANR
jgi:hypothetical protein